MRCDHHEWADGDEDVLPSGPQCDAEATHTRCDPVGSKVCEKHRCGCSRPLTAMEKPVEIDVDGRLDKRGVDALFTREYVCHGYAVPAGGRCPECNAPVPL